MTIDYTTQIKDNKAYKIPPKSKVVSIKLKENQTTVQSSIPFSHANKENIHPHSTTNQAHPINREKGSITSRNSQIQNQNKTIGNY